MNLRSMGAANATLMVGIVVLLLWPSGPLVRRVEQWRQTREVRHRARLAWPEISKSDQVLYAGQGDSRKLVVFSDYECPFCRALERSIEQLIADSANIEIIFRHYPLTIHPYAESAARAAVCAQAQGRFTAMHRALFSSSAWHADGNVAALVRQAGISDSAVFRTCLMSDSSLSVVSHDLALAERLGFSGTPVIVSSSRIHLGAMSPEQLRRFADR